MASSTPKKIVKRKGRNPKPKCKDDYCRICNVDFKIQFGNSTGSTENLFKESGRKESKGLVLATACQFLGLHVPKNDHLSDRVCQPCARKIKNAKDNLEFLRSNLESRPQEPVFAEASQRSKRQLPTTITPDRQASHGRLKTPESSQIRSRKQLVLSEGGEEKLDAVTEVPSQEDAIQNLMNIETFDINQAKKASQVRVVIVYPNGDVQVKQGFDETTTSLIRNIAQKKWSAAANVAFDHTEIRSHIPDLIRRKVNCEFQEFGSNTILKGRSLEEIAAYNNNLLLKEVQVFCPLWFSALNGACGHTLRQSKARHSTAVNVMALSTSVLARQRNPCLSALAYRISVLLFHSGVKYQDIRRLNHLGLCMSPARIVTLQKEMGVSFDSKVLIWKKTIEDVLSALLFLRSIKEHQVPQLKEDDMEIDIELDICKETVESYASFSLPTYEFCVRLLNEVKNKRAETTISSVTLDDAIYVLQNRNLPHFR